MSRKPRIATPREDAPEDQFRRQVCESLRELDRFLGLGIGVGQLRGQFIELEVEGDDVDIVQRLDPEKIKARPYGIWTLEVYDIAGKRPGSLGSTVPWEYRTSSGKPEIRFLNFPGLSTGRKYRVRFFVIAGD